MISSVGPVDGLGKLRVLHLRDNQLESLDGMADLGMLSLSYLNLRYATLPSHSTLLFFGKKK